MISVNFKPVVVCEAADQKMSWLITAVLAAKLVIDGTCYFTVLGIFITLEIFKNNSHGLPMWYAVS